MLTRRNLLLAATSLPATAILFAGGAAAASPPSTRPASRGADAADAPEPIPHDRWAEANHGYYMISKGVLAVGLLDKKDEDERETNGKPPVVFRPWHNVLIPFSDIQPSYRPYPLREFGGTVLKPLIEIGRPVLPPVFTLDDQPLGEEFGDKRGTRVGYADVGLAWFLSWNGVYVEPEVLSPAKREGLRDLRRTFTTSLRGGADRTVYAIETWVPPDRVAFLRSLYAPPEGEPPSTRGVIRFLSTIGLNISYSFGDDLFSDPPK